MAKDTIGIGVSNVARLMDAGWIGVSNVAREIEEVWIGDTSGKAQLAWSNAVSKVKAVFNGYSYSYSYSNPGGDGTASVVYDTDNSKSITPSNSSYIVAISKDGYYYLKTQSSKQTVYCDMDAETQVSETVKVASTDYIKSTSVYSANNSLLLTKFSADSSRLCYAFTYRTASGAKYSLALVFWKFDSSTGKFVYEKDICLYQDALYSYSAVSNIKITDDFSTVAYTLRNSAGSYDTTILKGSPDSGYTIIYTSSSTAEYENGEMQLDEECGEYVTFYAGIFYISGNTVTQIMTETGNVGKLAFSYDRSVMYIEIVGSSDSVFHNYAINGATLTSLGSYDGGNWFGVYDENSKGEGLVYYGSTGTSSKTMAHATLSKNSNGAIVGHTAIRTFGNDGYISSSGKMPIRFYSTEV